MAPSQGRSEDQLPGRLDARTRTREGPAGAGPPRVSCLAACGLPAVGPASEFRVAPHAVTFLRAAPAVRRRAAVSAASEPSRARLPTTRANTDTASGPSSAGVAAGADWSREPPAGGAGAALVSSAVAEVSVTAGAGSSESFGPIQRTTL